MEYSDWGILDVCLDSLLQQLAEIVRFFRLVKRSAQRALQLTHRTRQVL